MAGSCKDEELQLQVFRGRLKLRVHSAEGFNCQHETSDRRKMSLYHRQSIDAKAAALQPRS